MEEYKMRELEEYLDNITRYLGKEQVVNHKGKSTKYEDEKIINEPPRGKPRGICVAPASIEKR